MRRRGVVFSLSRTDVSQMTDLGLISVLPLSFYVAIVLLTCGFCLELSHRPVRVAVVLPYIVVLIFVLYGTPALVEHMPRYASTWKHLGVTDYIVRHGAVDPRSTRISIGRGSSPSPRL